MLAILIIIYYYDHYGSSTYGYVSKSGALCLVKMAYFQGEKGHQIRILGAKLLFNYVQSIYRYPLTCVFVATDDPNAVVHKWSTDAFLLNHHYK